MSRVTVSLIFLVSIILSVMSTMSFSAPASASEALDSCQCQESSCGPCEIETGTSFYSEKCGSDLSKVKSCKRPTCEPVENQKACLELMKKEGASKNQNSTPAREPASESAAETSGSRRASSKAPMASSVGEIIEVIGSGRVTRAAGAKESARKSLALYEGDIVETLRDGKIKIALKDGLKDGDDATRGSELVLTPNSKMRLETVRASTPTSVRDVTLKLLSGKLRSRVAKKVSSAETTFRVITRSAVAGVRGTDFVTSFEPGEKEWITEVRTFTGKVELGGAGVRGGDAPAKTIDVTSGTYAAFVIEAPPRGADEKMIEEAIGRGELSPLLLMKPEDAKLLDEATDLRPAEVARADQAAKAQSIARAQPEFVCQEPGAQFNQCSFACEGQNPKGEKSCRTDLPGISCVRRLCRASGQWAEVTRLPASQADLCVPNKTVVRECGAYW